MKHIFYVLLSALALLLASCKKDKNHTDLDGTWLQIGDAGFLLNWYPPSYDNRMQLENSRYTRYYKNGSTSSGSFELFRTNEKQLAIRFSGENQSYSVAFMHDTLCIWAMGGGDMAFYFKRATF